MRKDHRPYLLKKTHLKLQQYYARHFLRPHFESLGENPTILRPWHVEVFGAPIVIGDYAMLIAASDNKIRLSVWSDDRVAGRIHIGHYCMLCPGVRISSASEIRIGDNCQIASGAYLTDSDWHDVYNRIAFGKTAPIRIENNVWIGDSAIICKGVSIGENSIIGAGAIVVESVPANCIAAGNPAKVVKSLDPEERFITRQEWFEDPDALFRGMDRMDRVVLRGNSFLHWLRYVFFPSKGD